ncbi:MAG: hypothetical protein ACI9OU_000088 [Candidatus Promineifilaceae bacterium]|jgi:hypothetical protein
MAITVKKTASPKTLRVAPRATGNPTAQAAVASSGYADLTPKRSYTPDVVLGILGCIVFAALITIQMLEWRFYEEPPQRAFPLMSTDEPLSLAQQWGAAPLGIQVGISVCAFMLLLGIISLVMTIVKAIKAKSDSV